MTVALQEEREPEPGSKLLAALFKPVYDILEGIGLLLTLTFHTVAWIIRPPYRVSLLLAAMDFMGVQSVFIVSLTGIFSGMVLSLETVDSLSKFGAQGVVGSVVAISLTKEISPVFASLMVTARAGSAMAAEIGNMRVTEQVDALTTMGVSPIQYLLSPRLVAAVLMMPLLCVLYTAVGMCGAYFVAVKGLSVDPGIFTANIEKDLVVNDFMMGAIKAAVFGFLIAAISCSRGFSASGGARGVGLATTQAVVQSSVAILVANYVITSWMTT